MGLIYALMEIKHSCEQQEVCSKCPLYDEVIESCGVTSTTPYEWDLKYDISIKSVGNLFASEMEET